MYNFVEVRMNDGKYITRGTDFLKHIANIKPQIDNYSMYFN